MLFAGRCGWGSPLGCLHHSCILGGRGDTRGKYLDSLLCLCLNPEELSGVILSRQQNILERLVDTVMGQKVKNRHFSGKSLYCPLWRTPLAGENVRLN